MGACSVSFRRWLFITVGLVIMATIFAACGQGSKGKADGKAPILLFTGTGVSTNDVTAIQTILDDNQLGYNTVTSSEFSSMNSHELGKYRLLIFPGGNFIDMGKSLTTATAANISNAVQHGLNYMGICAGAFLAGKSAYYNGFNLTSGVKFGFYNAVNKGISKAALAITSPNAPTLDQYWENGPQLSGWGMVIAKYPDGTPAVTQGKYGKGNIVLTGIHPEAPEYWRGAMLFNTPASTDNAYALMLIRAALNGTQLPHY